MLFPEEKNMIAVERWAKHNSLLVYESNETDLIFIRGGYLGLHILDADDSFFVFLRGLLVASLFVQLVSLAMQHRNNLQPLLIAQSP